VAGKGVLVFPVLAVRVVKEVVNFGAHDRQTRELWVSQ
jgi:hypothetical protein